MQRGNCRRAEKEIGLGCAQPPAPIFYCIDKAAGVTTREAVKKLLQVKGRGFGVEGILDPFASGLLIAATGLSTRFLPYFLAHTKSYTAELTLGSETDTLDPSGVTIRSMPVPAVSEAALAAVCERFLGEQQQQPPLFSNIKIAGERAHRIAREGRSVELQPRRVTIHQLAVAPLASARLAIECTVSAGTYIRSLGRDLASALGTCGHLSSLRRTRIGQLSLPKNAPVEQVGLITAEKSDFDALDFFPTLQIGSVEVAKFRHGNPFAVEGQSAGIFRICFEERFLGLGRMHEGKLLSEKVYPD